MELYNKGDLKETEPPKDFLYRNLDKWEENRISRIWNIPEEESDPQITRYGENRTGPEVETGRSRVQEGKVTQQMQSLTLIMGRDCLDFGLNVEGRGAVNLLLLV
jgi:hypothetical protein